MVGAMSPRFVFSLLCISCISSSLYASPLRRLPLLPSPSVRLLVSSQHNAGTGHYSGSFFDD